MIEKIAIDRPPEELFARFAHLPDASLLNSSMETDVGRYSFIGIEPFLVLTCKNDIVELRTGGHKLSFRGDPFEFLDSVLGACRTENSTPLPFTAGGIGYLSYDLKDVLERLPQKTNDDLGLPDMYFAFYRALLIQDKRESGALYISVLEMERSGNKKTGELIKEIKSAACSPSGRAYSSSRPGPDKSCFESNFSKNGYIDSVRKVIDYIRAGDIYQACLSQRFKTKWPHLPYELYLKLNRINPAPFSAYLNFEQSKIISSSPELFLKVADGIVETRPMKGTRPRGENAEKDAFLKSQLEKSPKDSAELAMIVDLERNDLGKISVPGSVEVIEPRRIETYPTVFQTISVVRGIVDKPAGMVDVIKAAFPGGSITGCPKIRAMEIIDELEPTRRNVYTGAIGYISFHDTMELSIAIRTMIMKEDNVYFQSGGGIVADSEGEAEYRETLDKARALAESLTLNCKW